MTEEKGFSYESPEKQKKNATRTLVIEFAIGIVAVLLIVVLLNFLNIISLSQLNPTIFGWLPTQNTPRVTLDSQIKGYSVELRNEKELINLLRDWGVFDNHLDWGSFGRTGNEKLRNISIVVTNQEIVENATVNAEGKVQIGSNAKLNGQNLEIRIYVNPTVWKDNETEFVNGNAVLMGFVTPIYRATYPATEFEPNPRAPRLFDVVGELATKNIFSVRKL